MDQTSETEKVYQRNKYNEIIEILLTAGYFRARINTLSEFDKVVGGLCWCITSSGEIVDVDILFQENSTIGQKITLSEAIVKALRKMGCPAPLQPHQIQGGVGGSDYPALHAAIVWLVKKYFERRGEREKQLRAYSTFQFSKNYQLPGETNSGINIADILNRGKAVRSYKRKETTGESEVTRVRACLLEFGESFNKKGQASGTSGQTAAGSGGAKSEATASGGEADADGKISVAGLSAAMAKMNKVKKGGEGEADAAGASAVGEELSSSSAINAALAGFSKLDNNELSAFERQLAKAAREAKREEQLLAEQVTREETEIMKQMHQIDEEAAQAVSGSQVGSIVGLGSSEIGSALAAYQAELEEQRKQMDSNLASGKMGQAAAFNRQKQNLIKQKEEVSVKETEVSVATKVMNDKLHVLEEDFDGAEEYIEQLKAQIVKLSELEAASTQQEELLMLKKLVGLNEDLKAQEAAYKAACKAEMLDYQAKIKACDEEESEDTEENKKLRDIEDMHGKVSCDGGLLFLKHCLTGVCCLCLIYRFWRSTTSCVSCWLKPTWRWLMPSAPLMISRPEQNSFSMREDLWSFINRWRGSWRRHASTTTSTTLWTPHWDSYRRR